MGLFRAVVCVILPPLAVLDKGCGSVLIVFVLTLCGWVPGVVGAILICMLDQNPERYVFVDDRRRGGDAIDVEAREVNGSNDGNTEH